MTNPEKLSGLKKDDLISSLLDKKFSTVKGGRADDRIIDICSVDPCCDGASECSFDICSAICD